MPRLFRQHYTKPVPEGAEIVTVKGKQHARFTDGGRTATAPLTKKGDRIRLHSAKWYGEYCDADGFVRRVPLSTDKSAAQQLLAELVRKAELGRAGIGDPFESHRKRPLKEHLEDYRRELSARDNAPRYVALVVSRLRSLLDGCGFRLTPDLSASRAMDWLADLRHKGRHRADLPAGQDNFTAKEVAKLLGIKAASVGAAVRRNRLEATGQGKARRFPRATVEALQERFARGASVQTTNDYLSALKSFGRWMVKDRRLAENPFAHLEGATPRWTAGTTAANWKWTSCAACWPSPGPATERHSG